MRILIVIRYQQDEECNRSYALSSSIGLAVDALKRLTSSVTVPRHSYRYYTTRSFFICTTYALWKKKKSPPPGFIVCQEQPPRRFKSLGRLRTQVGAETSCVNVVFGMFTKREKNSLRSHVHELHSGLRPSE